VKIGSKTLSKKNNIDITLYRGDEPYVLTVGPLPPKFMERIRDHVLVRPEPPRKPVESSPGKFVTEGEGKNRKVVYEEDTKDPAYKAAFMDYYSLFTVAKLRGYLEHDPNIQFDVQKPTTGPGESPEQWKQFLVAAREELTDENTGFTDAEIGHILEVGEKTELKLDIDEATKDFLPSR
jgi:hypothetical protein